MSKKTKYKTPRFEFVGITRIHIHVYTKVDKKLYEGIYIYVQN